MRKEKLITVFFGRIESISTHFRAVQAAESGRIHDSDERRERTHQAQLGSCYPSDVEAGICRAPIANDGGNRSNAENPIFWPSFQTPRIGRRCLFGFDLPGGPFANRIYRNIEIR
jgi:hypothetical protein